MAERVVLFRDMSEKACIEAMHKYSITKVMGLSVPKNSPVSDGDRLQIEQTKEGKVVAKRHHVFFFWRTEYLVERETRYGRLYTWFPKSKITFK